MLNHASHRIVPVPKRQPRHFHVFMETGGGQVLYFNWAAELVRAVNSTIAG